MEVVKSVKWEDGKLIVVDQTLLPVEYREVELKTVEDVASAIKRLVVRGAPLIGVVAGYGVVVGAKRLIEKGLKGKKLREEIENAVELLRRTRPTAYNLFYALSRQREHLAVSDDEEMLLAMEKTAVQMHEEDRLMCEKMGLYGAELVEPDSVVLTHCNTGALATAGIGTALGVIYMAYSQGKIKLVFADETRPLLQGARLTAWELHRAGVPVKVICDDMAGVVMRDKKVNAVFVGADRIARNGDTANKIGTYALSILAKYHGIPFYVVAPSTTFDLSIETGKDIPIEERNPDEVRKFRGEQTAPPDVDVYNPAFDVTPSELITAIITEKGVIHPPFKDNIERLMSR